MRTDADEENKRELKKRGAPIYFISQGTLGNCIFLFLFALLQHAVDIRMIRKENVTTSRESLFGREHILI